MATKTPKRERIAEFFRRLDLYPPASSSAEARDHAAAALTETEDALSGIKDDPSTGGYDGRMYPPTDRDEWPPTFTAKTFRVRNHKLYFGTNGAIEVQDIHTGAFEFSKAGADHRLIWAHPSNRPGKDW